MSRERIDNTTWGSSVMASHITWLGTHITWQILLLHSCINRKMMLQRGNQLIGPLRGETNLWRGRGNEGKSWLAGLPKHICIWGHNIDRNWGLSRDDPMSRDLLGKLPNMIM